MWRIEVFRSRRSWLLATLAVLAVIYSVVATWYWMLSWTRLLPIMDRSFFYRMLLGPLWYGVQLIPVTVGVTWLRVKFSWALVTVFVCGIIMNLTTLVLGQTDGYFVFILALQMGFNYTMQIPVAALAWLALRSWRRTIAPS
jgi:hypothetical protein